MVGEGVILTKRWHMEINQISIYTVIAVYKKPVLKFDYIRVAETLQVTELYKEDHFISL
jgi:hypothetical protein